MATRADVRGDRGGVAVEFALIAPILIALLFGVIEFSLLLRDHVATTSLVRAGARTASSMPRSSDMVASTVAAMERAGSALPKNAYEELWIYRARADGAPQDGSFETCDTECVRYTWDDDGQFRRSTGSDWDPETVNACPGDPEADSVGVYLRAEHKWLTGMFTDSTMVADHSVMRFEPVATLAGAIPCRA
ncbi:MAG: TadE/TadG family type IV pilus assembly protein [Candidatus Nanopelagicales bacterium]|nr:TadE/TadG family type IV pilus assembly protein [Candidatus Nanopelagicales bacterium]